MEYVWLFLLLLKGAFGFTYFPQMSNTIAVNEAVGELQVAGYLSPIVQMCLNVNYDVRSVVPRLSVLFLTEKECPTCKYGFYNNTEYFVTTDIIEYNKLLLAEANTNPCPTGYVSISKEACNKTYVESLGFSETLVSGHQPGTFNVAASDQPNGCYYTKTSGAERIKFNTPPGTCSGGGHTTKDACEGDGTCNDADKTTEDTCSGNVCTVGGTPNSICIWTAYTFTPGTGGPNTNSQPLCFASSIKTGTRKESVSARPTSSLMQPATYLMPRNLVFNNRSYLDDTIYYVGFCDNCETYVANVSIVSCPCYNNLLIPNPGDCNDMCPSQIGYQGPTGKHHSDYSYLQQTECKKCNSPGDYPDCNGKCPHETTTLKTAGSCNDASKTTKTDCDGNVCTVNSLSNQQCVWTEALYENTTFVMPDCNNLCEKTSCTSAMIALNTGTCKNQNAGFVILDSRYQNETESCVATDPKTTDSMCQNDCNGLCWWEDGWTRIDCQIRYHMGYMREDPLFHSNDVYETPTLTYSESWCPVGQFLSFQKNYINWEEINYKCEQCNRDTFLMHFNTPDSTSGQEHGACCQNMHHKMCGFMMDYYKFSCEEDKLKRGAERCSNNLYEFGYLSTVQKWTLNTEIVEEIHLRVGYTYILARVNNPGNLFSNPLRIIKESDCIGCTREDLTINGLTVNVFGSWTNLPTSSVQNILGGNGDNDALVNKPIYWRPNAAGTYYGISTTSRYLMVKITVTIH